MKIKEIIFVVVVLLVVVSCRELPLNFRGDKVVASVGDKELYESELKPIIPQGLSPEDSLSFVEAYTAKWILKSVKLREAERLFSSSAGDIESMVSDYRQSLLIRKLEQHTINSSGYTPHNADSIVSYYTKHSDEFRLSNTFVKGRVLRIPKDDKQTDKLFKMMRSSRERDSLDLVSIAQKRGYEMEDRSAEWIEYIDFLDQLPVAIDSKYEQYLRSGIQRLSDNSYEYLFEILDIRKRGEVEPLEMVESRIIRILDKLQQAALLEDHDSTLMRAAVQENVIKKYIEHKK